MTQDRLLGYTLREAMPGLADSGEPHLRKVLDTGQPSGKQIVEGTLPDTNDQFRKWEVRYNPLLDAAGQTLGISGVGVEITQAERDRRAVQQARDQAERERRAIEAIYDSAPVALCVVGPDLRFTEANDAIADMFGVPPQQFVGKTHRDLAPPATADFCERLIQQVFDTGKPIRDQTIEARDPAATHPPGDPFPVPDRSFLVSYVYVPLIDDAGHVNAVNAVGVETTQTHRDRRAVQQACDDAERDRREIEAIYQTAPVGLCVLDRDLRWLRINQRMAEINGFPVEAHAGKCVPDLLPDVADSVGQAVRHVMDTGEPIHDVEILGQTPAAPGQERAWTVSYTPIPDADGNPLAVNVIAKEITEQKQAEAKLEQALHTAERRKAELESIHAVSPAGLTYHDADLTIRYLNPQMEKINGVPNEQLLGTSPAEMPDDALAQQVVPLLQRVVLTGEPIVNHQLSWAPPYDPDVAHHVLVSYGPIYRGDESDRVVVGVMASVVDITEIVESRRKLESWSHQLEREVARRTQEVVEQNRRLHQLSEEVMDAQNRERQRVAKILHDDLQQTLAAARIDAGVLALRENKSGETGGVANSLKELLAEATDTARNLSHEL
ncbi:MAG: PAS domain-containing protein, partial [Planctomycetota bacterium]